MEPDKLQSILQIPGLILSVFAQAVHILDRHHECTHFCCLIPEITAILFKANSFSSHFSLVMESGFPRSRYDSYGTDEETKGKQFPELDLELA